MALVNSVEQKEDMSTCVWEEGGSGRGVQEGLEKLRGAGEPVRRLGTLVGPPGAKEAACGTTPQRHEVRCPKSQ